MDSKRINWIDWAKTTAITMVVFGHIPEARGSFLITYVCSFHMPFFFFLSGYLFKVRNNHREEFNKLKTSLIIPYFIYNIIFYPYWFIKQYIEYGGISSFYDFALKPLLGTICLQIETSYTTPLNGITWFLAVLFIIKITLIIFYKNEKKIIIIAIVIILINILNYNYHFAKSLTTVGLLESSPFYILGYLTKKHEFLIRNHKHNFITGLSLICISTIIHLSKAYIQETTCIILITFYSLSICGIYGTCFLCKSINNISSKIVINISTGTLMIMGIHWMFIGTINKILEHFYNLKDGIVYSWYEALILAIIIEACIYPFIIFAIKRKPILLGK